MRGKVAPVILIKDWTDGAADEKTNHEEERGKEQNVFPFLYFHLFCRDAAMLENLSFYSTSSRPSCHLKKACFLSFSSLLRAFLFLFFSRPALLSKIRVICSTFSSASLCFGFCHWCHLGWDIMPDPIYAHREKMKHKRFRFVSYFAPTPQIFLPPKNVPF